MGLKGLMPRWAVPQGGYATESEVNRVTYSQSNTVEGASAIVDREFLHLLFPSVSAFVGLIPEDHGQGIAYSQPLQLLFQSCLEDFQVTYGQPAQSAEDRQMIIHAAVTGSLLCHPVEEDQADCRLFQVFSKGFNIPLAGGGGLKPFLSGSIKAIVANAYHRSITSPFDLIPKLDFTFSDEITREDQEAFSNAFKRYVHGVGHPGSPEIEAMVSAETRAAEAHDALYRAKHVAMVTTGVDLLPHQGQNIKIELSSAPPPDSYRQRLADVERQALLGYVQACFFKVTFFLSDPLRTALQQWNKPLGEDTRMDIILHQTFCMVGGVEDGYTL
ncbi:hypothetical protein CC2G_013536 [Coprinopsis cinerea AmutBmut pab1-1]|nr:hypothetical protein CC2G_013536 [Coprinopsis cinerea AmutBmut pab1-1]